ncbi:MAG: radical SAM protein [Clostridia bacterium]|nr:radical SAM protein [Clostridia bacterium]
MPNKAFLEITNVCNLSCSFCHGTKREPKFISTEEFRIAAERLRPFADYLYFHLMGEPLLHPDLSEFLKISENLGFRVILTTNGTLLDKCADTLLSSPALHKVSISLHSYEANSVCESLESYLDSCFDFCRKASQRGIISVLRLWNCGGLDSLNDEIIKKMHQSFDENDNSKWQEIYSGYKIRDKLFLEWGNLFEWPDIDAEDIGGNHSCYGLRDQIGVLCDGTVVPCCLDADGSINLGNIFTTPLSYILDSDRAKNLRQSFIEKNVKEKLCRKCGYAKMKNYK